MTRKVSEEHMLDIAEGILRDLGNKHTESDWTVKDVFARRRSSRHSILRWQEQRQDHLVSQLPRPHVPTWNSRSDLAAGRLHHEGPRQAGPRQLSVVKRPGGSAEALWSRDLIRYGGDEQ